MVTSNLVSRRVCLAPVQASDVPFLHFAEGSLLGPAWRNRSMSMPIERFATEMWSGVLCQFLGRTSRDDRPFGWFIAMNADLSAKHVEVAVAGFSQLRGVAFLDAAELFISHLFRSWPLERIRFACPADSYYSFGSLLEPVAEVEGVRRDYYWYDDRLHDQVLGCLSRRSWDEWELPARVRRARDLRAE